MNVRKTFLMFVILVLTGALCALSAAQDDMWPGGTYNPDIPTPESILGYKIGERHTPHLLLEQYLEAMAAASDRVMLENLGKTYQGRIQHHVIISSPENLARLAEIQEDIKKLTVVDGSVSKAEIDRIVANTPAIAMLNYSVHGNEASGCEAALRTIYQLAAGTDEATLKILREVVTVIDPEQNPDGHDRYVNFINGYIVAMEDSNPQSFEHIEPWPGGRMNAYYFDLNRDWFLMTQVETWNRVRALMKWMPQVAPDLHEMGTNSTYFFHPPMLPINWNFPPVSEKWLEIYGRSNAEAFDRFGWTYYTRESFDMLYPGYGESLPALLGSVGMTYEQASARSRSSERRDGTVLDLHRAVSGHFITSMATLTTTAERREERLRDFNKFFVDAVVKASEGEIKEVYLPPGDPIRFNKLIQRMQRIGGVVYRAREPFTVKGAYDYFTTKKGDVELPAGTAIIPLRQPSGLLLKAILEPNSKLDEDFIKEERERMERGEGSRFYDVSAWSLPLTYGLQAYAAGTVSRVDKEPMAEITDIRPQTHAVAQAKVAYLIPPDTNANIALTVKLMQADYKVRVARKEFTLDGVKYAPGTVVVLPDRNNDSLHADINKFIAETGGRAVAADSGYTPEGIDLGSENILAVRKPKIALLADRPISSYNFGAIRYLFEQVYGLKYTAFPTMYFNGIDLDKFNVLIMPSSRSFGNLGLKSILGKPGIDKLKDWIRKGGVVIAIGGSVDFLSDKEVGLSAAPKYTQRKKEAGEVDDPYQSEPPAARQAEQEEKKPEAADKAKEKEKKYEVEKLYRTPGAILKVRLDDLSYLSWGYKDGFAAVLVDSNDVFEPISKDQGRAAGRYYARDEMLLSGFVWPENSELLPGKAYVWHQQFGRGQVICFSEDPTFRASYDGLDRLFFNAVLFAQAFVY